MFGRRRRKNEDFERPKYISVYAYLNEGLFPPSDTGFRLMRTAQG